MNLSTFKAMIATVIAFWVCISYAQTPGYKFRKEIIIQSSQVSGNLTDFPVLISTTDNDLRTIANGGRVENNSGFDIAAIASSTNNCQSFLDFELEQYSPTTGKLEMWVKIPSLSGSNNTTIYLIYGNDQVSSDQSSSDVWSNNYQAVYHFTGDVNNKASNSFNGADYNTSSASSIVGDCRQFNAVGDSIVIDSDVIPSDNFTISCWFNPQSAPNSDGHTLFDIYGDGTGANAKYFYGAYTDSYIRWYYEDEEDRDVQISTSASINQNQWYYYTSTGGWNQNIHRLYLDGTSIASSSLPILNYFTPRTNLRIGDRNVNYVNYDRFIGLIDEFRVSTVQRSADWIETEFNNINNPSSFISVGTEENLVISTTSSGSFSNPAIWDGGVPNNALNYVYIGHDVTVDVDFSAAALEVQSGSAVTIQSNTTAEVCRINNKGTIVVETAGSIVQQTSTDLNNGSGTYNIQRNSGTIVDDTRYQYWSSPVSNTSMGAVFTGSNTSDFYYFDEGTANSWATQPSGATMTPGRGYITTGTIDISADSDLRTFPGTINNANIQLSTSNVSAGEYILAGNPYPSAISSTDFISANAGLSGTLWFWNHSTAQEDDANDAADYATWTGMGSTGGNTDKAPDDYIQSAQGFFVEASSSNPTISFANDMRVAGNNSQFFKTQQNEERNRLWLSITNDSNDYNQILVGFADDATDGVDRLYDGKKFKAHPRIAFYSLIDSVDFSIQGLQTPTYSQEKRIPLGVDAWISGSYSIKLDSLDNWPSDYKLTLIDHELDSIHDLRLNSIYNFQFNQTGSSKKRFELGILDLEKNETTGIDKIESSFLKTFISNNQLVVQSNDVNIQNIFIYDINGRILHQSSNLGTRLEQITLNTTGALLISVILENQESHKQLLMNK